MALGARSLFLYGFLVDETNSSIDFKASSGGPTLQATLTVGYYSLASLMGEVKRAMEAVDIVNTYTLTADRTISSGTQNRVSIATSGAFLSLLFASGPRTASTSAPLLGFAVTDRTGSMSYTGTTSSGTPLLTGDSYVPSQIGYNYLGPDFDQKVFGVKNVSASGLKEAVVYGIQKFVSVEFLYQKKTKVVTEWNPFMVWAIQQKYFEFTPEITSPSVVYEVTFEVTDADGNGMAFRFKEQLPQFPNEYRTGTLRMRLRAQ